MAGAPRCWRAGVEAEAAPFTFADETGRPAGFAVELLQAVAKDRQLDIDYLVLPWPELLRRFRTGEIDIICNVVDTPERHAFMAFSSTTVTMRGAMFTRSDRAPVREFAQLQGLKVAVPRDSRAHEYLRARDWGVTFVFLPSLAECLKAVHESRADAVFASEPVTKHLAHTKGYTGIVASELQFPEFEYREHFGVAPGETALLGQLNDGLVAVNRNGTFDRIYERWVGNIGPREIHWRDLRPYSLPLVIVLLVTLTALLWQRRMLRQVSRHADALRLSEERLSLVLEGSQDGFWDWDVRSDSILRSPRWFAMLGYEPADIPPGRQGYIELVHPDDRTAVVDNEREVWGTRGQFAVEFRMRAKDGTWKWVLDRGKVVARDPATGAPWRITGTHTDITARKLAEQEAENLQRKMQETQRLESLGVLAGGIAHDFNNLLTVILGNTSLLRLGRGLPPDTGLHLDKITAASHRAADLCRQLLAYAGKGAFTIERLDVNHIVRDTTHLLEVSLNRHATLEFSFGENLPLVEADPSQLQQVVMNLVMNASDAIGDTPGRIRIATTRTTLAPGALADALPSSDLPPGAYVKLEVSDTGCGMSPEVIRHIFDPFYTTKFTGRGLGLAAVLGIVRSHRGALTVRSTPGLGSVFGIHLPAAAAAEPTGTADRTAAIALGRASGVVLVADDDDSVRSLLGEMLVRLGYQPVLAADGREAISRFVRDPDRCVAALLDLTMPGLDGHATLRELRRHRPGLPCVLLSGYSEQEARLRDDTREFTGFLQKPLTPESLNGAILRATKRA